MIPKSTPIYYCKKTCMCHGRIVIIILKSGKTDKFPEKVPVKQNERRFEEHAQEIREAVEQLQLETV